MAGRRVFLIVLDGCGIGAMPDAALYHDPPGANTIGNVARHCGGLSLPQLARLGLRRLVDIEGTEDVAEVAGRAARVALKSPGKDTTTGHWEIAGIILDQPFDLFPCGFPDELISEFQRQTGCGGVLANCHASGTEVIAEYHQQHLQTGFPIVYTSADSVFQVAADVDVVPVTRLYEWCSIARRILNERARVGRVIARPFAVQDGKPVRLSYQRRDFAVPPPSETLPERVVSCGGSVFAIGKIEDIFVGRGISYSRHTSGNTHGIEMTLRAIDGEFTSDSGARVAVDGSCPQLVFVNLVDTDSLYGHRNLPQDFGAALQEIDAFVGAAISRLRDDDLLILVADHGCDPTVPGTDHTREYVPLLTYSPSLQPGAPQQEYDTLAVVSRIVSEWLQLESSDSWPELESDTQ